MTPTGIETALAALRDRSRTVTGDALEDRLSAAFASLDDPSSRLNDAILEELRRDRFVQAFALSRAQLELGVARDRAGPPPSRPGTGVRLTGTAKAMGLLLARTLDRGLSAHLPGREAAWDEAAYLAENPDVAAAGISGRRHYVRSGAAEGRPPGGLVARWPEVFAEMEGPPDTLDALAAADLPRFVADCPEPLRQRALDLVRVATPEVSVIIPTWNRAHVLPWALGSALLQSWQAREILVIDDGSDDGTDGMLAERFAGPIAEGRLKVLRTERAGVSAARNAGLAAAQGEIVAYLDSDNLWESDHLLFLGALFARFPEAEMAYSAIGRHHLDEGWADVLFTPWDRARMKRENIVDLNSFAHRRAALDRVGGFDEGLRRLVDWDFILRMSAGRDPITHPLVTAHHALSSGVLGNITLTEDGASARQSVIAKLAADRVPLPKREADRG